MDPLKALERLALEGYQIQIRSLSTAKAGYEVKADRWVAFGDNLDQAVFSLLVHLAGALHFRVGNEVS